MKNTSKDLVLSWDDLHQPWHIVFANETKEEKDNENLKKEQINDFVHILLDI